MAVTLAVVAVRAGDGRLDDTGAVFIEARDVVHAMAGVQARVDHCGARLRLAARRGAAQLFRDRLAHERSKLVVVHATSKVTSSTMPMIAASTGAPFLPSASP